MLQKDLFLNICGSNVMKIISEKNCSPCIDRDTIKSFEELKIRVRNRKLYIILEGEEIHVKLLRLPKVYNEDLDKMIENEMIYLYGTKAEEIYYDYSIFKENENELEILVFCVNCQFLSNIKSYNKFQKRIKKVSLVQIYFIEYFKKHILESKYILVLKYFNHLYFTAIYENKIIANKVLKGDEEDYGMLIKGINFIKDKIKFIDISISNVYTCNINNEDLSQYLSSAKDIKYKKLEELKESKVVEYFIKNRR